MGRAFFAATGHPAKFSAAAFSDLLLRLMDGDASVLFVSDGGMIGGSLAPLYCSPDCVTAVEFFWWSTDGRGMRLLRDFEGWAADMVAYEVRMTRLAAFPDAERAMRGYSRHVTLWTRVI